MTNNIKIFTCWLIAMTATLGSLFFSEVMEFPPCSLCWYQRICMYPLCAIFLVSFITSDRSIFKYSFPLVIGGIFLSIYHNLLTWEIIPESAAPCREGVSCASMYIDWFGFVTIPLLSFLGFLVILILLLIDKKGVYGEK